VDRSPFFPNCVQRFFELSFCWSFRSSPVIIQLPFRIGSLKSGSTASAPFFPVEPLTDSSSRLSPPFFLFRFLASFVLCYLVSDPLNRPQLFVDRFSSSFSTHFFPAIGSPPWGTARLPCVSRFRTFPKLLFL